MQQALLLFLAVMAGIILPIQAALNAKMGDAVKDPMYATFISFIVGMVGLLAYLLAVRTDFSQISHMKQEHWTVWTGGLIGAFYVASIIVLAPRLGLALTFGLTVAGQMVMSLVMDHYGWLGIPVQAISWQRVLGIALIVGGVLLVRKF